MDFQKLAPAQLWRRRREWFSFEAILTALALLFIAAFHRAAFEDRIVLNLYYLAIAVVVFSLARRHAIGLILLVVAVTGVMTMVQVYFSARPGTSEPALNLAADVTFWLVAAFLGWQVTVESCRFRARSRRREIRRHSQKEAMATRATALSVTSNELRKPVSNILSLAEDLLDRSAAPLTKGQRESLDDIEESGRQLMALVDDVLAYGKAEAGEIALARETVALPELINQCVASVNSRVSNAAVTVVVQVDPNAGEIIADPLRLKQILLNLLLNAVDLNEVGGFVRIQVRTVRRRIVISLRDTGKGISRQQVKHLFDPYPRDAGDNLPIEMRLRSAIARHLVRLHGGSLSANSVSNSGTVFTIRLPKVSTPDTDAATAHLPEDVQRETSRTAPPSEAPATETVERRREPDLSSSLQMSDEAEDANRVLVADENPTVRKILRNMFASLGWETLEASDGRQALERARRRPVPHAVVLDLKLPEMNGADVCRALKSDEQLRLIPVLLTTSADSPEEKLGALDAGADDILAKPINRAELTVRFRSLLRTHRFNQEMIGAESVARALARAVAAKDGYAQSHIERVATHAVMFGKVMGLDAAELKVLEFGALLHNVGKIAVPDAVLEKTGPLTRREKAMFQQHPRIGCDICAPLESLRPVLPIIRHHKENWDGTGYPDKLQGDEIPLGAQIVGVVDAYAAMTSDRPYRPALSHADAIQTLREECRQGRRSPELTERFIESLASAAGAEDSTGPEPPTPSACREEAPPEPLAVAAATDLQ